MRPTSSASYLSATERYFLDRFRAATIVGAVERAASEELEHGQKSFAEFPRSLVPVDVETIARRKSIRLQRGVGGYSCAEARLIPVPGGFLCDLTDGSVDTRKRFSLAHEIGHTLFYAHDGRTQPRHQIGMLATPEIAAEERICNMFAGALLMPDAALKASLKAIPEGRPAAVLRIIEQLGLRFRVSVPALLTRMRTVHVRGPSYLVLYLRMRENPATRDEPKLRVDTCCAIGSDRRLWTWRNRSAAGLNLRSAGDLFDAWRATLAAHVQPSGGRYVLDDKAGLLPRKATDAPEVFEQVNFSVANAGRWPKEIRPVKVASCLYVQKGATEREAHVLSVLAPEIN